VAANPNHIYNYINNHNLIDNAILNGPNGLFNFDDKSMRLLFFNDLQKPMALEDFYNNKTEEKVTNVTCRFNNEGFRSDDFTSGTEILISGCSHTYGMGVPEEHIWASLIKNKLNKTVSNLGQPGASWTMIVNNLFAYFRKYGQPKTICVIFPNIERIQVPVNQNFLLTEKLLYSENLSSRYLQVSQLQDYIGPRISKRPHIARDIISPDLFYYLSIQSINYLELYCKSAGINLIWSTWDFMTGKSIEKMKSVDNSYFNGYFSLNMDHWCYSNIRGPDNFHMSPVGPDDKCLNVEPCDKVISCHNELKNKTELFFDMGLDNCHWGSHRHAHIAETVLLELGKYYDNLGN